MTFIASMTERNAPETPQSARRIEIMAPRVKVLSAWLCVMLRSWFSIKLNAPGGTTPEILSSMVLTRSVAFKRPNSESRKVKKGKMAKSAL